MMWTNQCRSQRDYELSGAGYFISLKTVIKLSIPCNLIALPTHTALPCAALRLSPTCCTEISSPPSCGSCGVFGAKSRTLHYLASVLSSSDIPEN